MTSRHCFTAQLYKFLQKDGYTHMQMMGIVAAPELDNELAEANYLLVPRKTDISILFEDAEIITEQLESPEIRKMLEFNAGMHFWVELPAPVAIIYAALYGMHD